MDCGQWTGRYYVYKKNLTAFNILGGNNNAWIKNKNVIWADFNTFHVLYLKLRSTNQQTLQNTCYNISCQEFYFDLQLPMSLQTTP